MIKAEFLTELDGSRLKRDKEILIKLNQPLIYISSKADKYYVTEGFESDGASIPKFAWSIVGHPFGEYLESAIVHDYLYLNLKKLRIKRKHADWVLLDAMKVQKVSFWKRQIIHKMVRIFGGIHNLLTK